MAPSRRASIIGFTRPSICTRYAQISLEHFPIAGSNKPSASSEKVIARYFGYMGTWHFAYDISYRSLLPGEVTQRILILLSEEFRPRKLSTFRSHFFCLIRIDQILFFEFHVNVL